MVFTKRKIVWKHTKCEFLLFSAATTLTLGPTLPFRQRPWLLPISGSGVPLHHQRGRESRPSALFPRIPHLNISTLNSEFALSAYIQLEVNLIILKSMGENDVNAGNISIIHWLFPTKAGPLTASLHLPQNYLAFERSSFDTNRLGYLHSSIICFLDFNNLPHSFLRVSIIK